MNFSNKRNFPLVIFRREPCKLFLCKELRPAYPELYEKLEALRRRALEGGITATKEKYWGLTKEEVLKKSMKGLFF